MKNWQILAGVVVATALATLAAGRIGDAPTPMSATSVTVQAVPSLGNPAPARGREQFVGSAACAPCHAAQARAYSGSHHARALSAPSTDFAKERFEGQQQLRSELGGTTTFSRRQGVPVVSTPVAAGSTEIYPIRYVAGVWPLEQYVVATERGKLQSLGVAWDSRSATAGGNRFFHVYGPQGVAPSDTLFFTAPAQNWNHVCADCHSTRVERGYDSLRDSFDTRWAETSVGCEACHGPGAEHVRSAQAAEGKAGLRPTPFAAKLKASEPWIPSATGSPAPRAADDSELEVCAPCHSRRTPLLEGFVASDPFLDSFEPDLLRPARYHADGQVEGEVFEWGSFRQSRMYAAGVRCSDCHDAHSGKVLANGNALCVRCHDASRFDTTLHSRHAREPGSAAGSGRSAATMPLCIDCHMPKATFMQVDERRDHSIRIPRPDHSVKYGTPNACNGCHTKESPAWARDWIAKWSPRSLERPHFVDALGKDRQGALDAPRALRGLATDARQPAIARATALERLGSYDGEKTRQTLDSALRSSDALVVLGAVRGAAQLPPPPRLALLLPVLRHPRRAVRVAAGKALASASPTSLPPSEQAALERAFVEVHQSFELSASQPQTHVEKSAFELARGRLPEAEAALQHALRLEPCLAEAHLNLADVARQRGDETAAERAIRAALTCNPKYAAAHHALGLWQVRARRHDVALVSLGRAASLVPTEPRFGYVLAVALASRGRRDEAVRTLEKVLEARPNDASALQALAESAQSWGPRWRRRNAKKARVASERLSAD